MALLGASIAVSLQDEATDFFDTGTVAAEPEVSQPAAEEPDAPDPVAGLPTVDIAGVALTQEQLEETIKYLAACKGNQVKNPLVMMGSPLASVDYLGIAAQEIALDPTLRKGNAKTKKAFLRHLYKKLAEFGTSTPQPATPEATSFQKLVDFYSSKPSKDAGEDEHEDAGQEKPTEDHTPPAAPPSPTLFQGYVAAGTNPLFWTPAAREAFIEHYGLDKTGVCGSCYTFACAHTFVYERINHRLAELKREAAQEAINAALALTFTPADPQPQLGGFHPKTVLVDQHGDRWLFKPAPNGKAFRSEVEHGAHRLARAWGFPTAESRLITHDGQYGQLQRMFVETGNFAGITGKAFTTFSVRQLIAVACEHALDWGLDNDDTKGDNLIVTEHGQVIGVDKARSWLYYGGWDGLSSHDSANSNAPLVYTELYRAIKAHDLDKETVDIIYRAVIAKARKMSTLPDATLAGIIGDAVANRAHFAPPSYRAAVPGAPANADELVIAATARKNSLADDMRALWARVYADAGWEPPSWPEPELGYNAQGEPMFAGLHSPGLHESVTRTKCYGTPTFVSGTAVEDAHILLWREREKATGVFRVRGQLKIRDTAPAYMSLVAWCEKHATVIQGPKHGAGSDVLPNSNWYWAVVKANRDCGESWNYGYLGQALKKITAQAAEAAVVLQTTGDDEYGRQAAIVAMCEHYREAIEDIIDKRKHIKPYEPILDAGYTAFEWVPKAPPVPKLPDNVTVELRAASRAAASRTVTVKLADDGELDLDGTVLYNNDFGMDHGQYGRMYLVTLPTGEQIEFRGGKDVTSETLRGLIQFTVPDQATTTESLRRIDSQLALMGLALAPADRTDLELFYWRHLRGVLGARSDSKPAAGHDTYRPFWAAVTEADKATDRGTELGLWRQAFAALPGGERIPGLVEAGGHLPRFLHLDQRRPEQPCGKPHWMRFDVTQEQINAKSCLGTAFGHGPHYVMATGAAMSTEARIRTFAMYKPGASSCSDLNRGSGDFTFTRQNYDAEDGLSFNVYFRPDALARTTTYTFNGDNYGRASYRPRLSHFGWDEHTGCKDTGNETMVKYAMSLLDDVEVLVFNDAKSRQKAIKQLAGHGITQIRGMAVTERLITGTGQQRQIALERARRARKP
jgi:hypothetical protein